MYLGLNGVGKSTLAASFGHHGYKVDYLDLEFGSGGVSGITRRFQNVYNYNDFDKFLTEYEASNPSGVLVIDSGESIYDMIRNKILEDDEVSSLVHAAGGYGNGYKVAAEYMGRVVTRLQTLARKHMSYVVLIAHVNDRKFSDPVDNIQYNTFDLRMHEDARCQVCDLADDIFFIRNVVSAKKANKNDKVHQAFSDGERALYTQWRPGFRAKTRLNLPFEIPLCLEDNFAGFHQALKGAKLKSAEELLKDINGLIEGLDKEAREKVVKGIEAANNNPSRLQTILNAIETKLG